MARRKQGDVKDTATPRRSSKSLEVQRADELVRLVVDEGKSLADAAEIAGISARSSLVKVRLEQLSVYKDLVSDEEKRDLLANAILMEKALDPETDTRDVIAAASKLQRKSDAPLIEISLSEEVKKLQPGNVFDITPEETD